MTDGKTYAINKHLDGALQELTAEIEQAEARIEELEEMLMSATMDGYDMAKNEYRKYIEELEANLAKAVEALGGMVGLFSGYSLLLKGMHLNMELDNARTTLTELKGQDDE